MSATTELNNPLHSYFQYDASNESWTNKAWEIAWKTAAVVAALAFIAFATFATIMLSADAAFTTLPIITTLVLFMGLPTSSKVVEYLWNRGAECAIQSDFASRVNEKIQSYKTPEDALNKLTITMDFVNPTLKNKGEQIKAIVARAMTYHEDYTAHMNAAADKEKIQAPINDEKVDVEVKKHRSILTIKPGDNSAAQYQAVQQHDLGVLRNKQMAAINKMHVAFCLFLLKRPDMQKDIKELCTIYSYIPPDLRLEAKGRGDKSAFTLAEKGKLKFSIEGIIAQKDLNRLSKELFE